MTAIERPSDEVVMVTSNPGVVSAVKNFFYSKPGGAQEYAQQVASIFDSEVWRDSDACYLDIVLHTAEDIRVEDHVSRLADLLTTTGVDLSAAISWGRESFIHGLVRYNGDTQAGILEALARRGEVIDSENIMSALRFMQPASDSKSESTRLAALHAISRSEDDRFAASALVDAVKSPQPPFVMRIVIECLEDLLDDLLER